MNAALEIEKSVSGNRWVFREVDQRQVMAIQQQFRKSELLAKILSARNVEVDTAESFLNPTLKNAMPDPFHYLDMEKAANRLADAVVKGEKIGIFGDYDVDGATSSSLLKLFFQSLGAEAIIHIPDRIEEGYGPNEGAIQSLWDKGARVLITVDCGTVSYEPLAAAKRIGFDTIVVDHHIGGEQLPEAYAIINPCRMDESTEHRYLAAVGVSFMLAVAVQQKLRGLEFFAEKKEPNLMRFLDLVALGTICDVMPIIGMNRAFVAQGLKVMAARGNVGLAALCDVSKLSEKPAVFHLGFLLGPRINAGGRVGEASLGARLLTTNNPNEAKDIAEHLDRLNQERKAIEVDLEEEATRMVENEQLDSAFLMPVGRGWHQGVIGIVASRLKERFNRPTALVAVQDGIAKASCRSITGVDLGAAVASAQSMGLTISGGGHAMAAGFTAEEAKLPELRKFLEDRLRPQVENAGEKILKLDAVLNVNGITPQLAQEMEQAAPFGTGNSEPRLVIADCRLVSVEAMNGGHVRCVLDDGIGGKKRVYAMAFRSMEKDLGQFLVKSQGRRIHLAVRIRHAFWQGREKVDVQIDDAVLC